MSERVLAPLGGTLRALTYEEDGRRLVLFDIEIPVRVAISSPVDPEFLPGTRPMAVEVEGLDLGVFDWRHLAAREVSFPADQDGAFYLGGVHNPVEVYRIRFGEVRGDAIRAEIELGFDFRCVKPRPPELEASFRVRWEVELTVISDIDRARRECRGAGGA